MSSGRAVRVSVCVISLPDAFLALCLTLSVLASFIVDNSKTVQYNAMQYNTNTIQNSKLALIEIAFTCFYVLAKTARKCVVKMYIVFIHIYNHSYNLSVIKCYKSDKTKEPSIAKKTSILVYAYFCQ